MNTLRVAIVVAATLLMSSAMAESLAGLSVEPLVEWDLANWNGTTVANSGTRASASSLNIVVPMNANRVMAVWNPAANNGEGANQNVTKTHYAWFNDPAETFKNTATGELEEYKTAEGFNYVNIAGFGRCTEAQFIEKFGPAQYVSSGAGPDNRPYLSLNKFAAVTTSGVQPSIFNVTQQKNITNDDGDVIGTTTVGNNTGYTEVMYLRASPTMSVTQNAGLGGAHNTSSQNFPLALMSSGVWQSQTTMNSTASGSGTYWSVTTTLNANTLAIPRDVWFQFVKVHDIAESEVRYYVTYVDAEGEIQQLTYAEKYTTTVDFSEWYYPDRGDVIGTFGGVDDRWVQGLDYSYFAAYGGVMSAADITASFNYLAGISVPEPATMGLLALGGLALLRRRT